MITITAILIDFYGNPVVDAPISFVGTGVDKWLEVGYELYTDEGVPAGGLGNLDSCFTWRDYGFDNDPSTPDMGNFNDNHDAFDINGDGIPDSSEVSEPFADFGLAQQPDTHDFGENNGEWDGYSMINCEPIVKTDQDGYARIQARFKRGLCVWQSTDDETNICTFEDFTATISATLLIPQITTSDPFDIQLVRSPSLVCN